MNSYSYQLHEMTHLALAPARAMSGITRLWFNNPANPLAHTPMGRNMAASAELFERLTRRYGKPVFGIDLGDDRWRERAGAGDGRSGSAAFAGSSISSASSSATARGSRSF